MAISGREIELTHIQMIEDLVSILPEDIDRANEINEMLEEEARKKVQALSPYKRNGIKIGKTLQKMQYDEASRNVSEQVAPYGNNIGCVAAIRKSISSYGIQQTSMM